MSILIFRETVSDKEWVRKDAAFSEEEISDEEVDKIQLWRDNNIFEVIILDHVLIANGILHSAIKKTIIPFCAPG